MTQTWGWLEQMGRNMWCGDTLCVPGLGDAGPGPDWLGHGVGELDGNLAGLAAELHRDEAHSAHRLHVTSG